MWAADSWKANSNTMNDTPNPAGREGGGVGTHHNALFPATSCLMSTVEQ